jgi:hypothetical protein
MLAGVAGGMDLATAQGAAATPAASSAASQQPHSHNSLGDELKRTEGREVHIFFIHGIGSDGPGSHDSLALRKSICAWLKDCTSPAGEQVGSYDYADKGRFAPDGPLPGLEYMGHPVWTSAEQWRAAAPFAVHYRLARTAGAPVYVDELNWWPLVLALKCREIIGADARLTGPAPQRIKTCSTRTSDAGVPGRFLSYDWIPPDEAARLLALPRRGALANRTIKNNLADWGFADAIVALGPLHDWLASGLRQLILKSVKAANLAVMVEDLPGSPLGNPLLPAPRQEFVIVTHSLGSYLIFSALNIDPGDGSYASTPEAREAFTQVLRQTSLVYFFANQVPLLELANLTEKSGDKDGNVPAGDEFAAHLEAWGKLRCDYLKQTEGDGPCRLPKIVALNDPSDLLTWRVPNLTTVEVQNYRVKNALHWFWVIEDPMKAHDNYQNDKRAIQEMLQPGKSRD